MILGVIPYFIMDGDAQEAVKFYEEVLDATVLDIERYGDWPDESDVSLTEETKKRVMHAHLKIADTDLMLADTFPGQPHTAGSAITMAVDSNDLQTSKEVFAKLLKGGEEVMALQETGFSPAYGQVIDKFGVQWQIITDFPESGQTIL